MSSSNDFYTELYRRFVTHLETYDKIFWTFMSGYVTAILSLKAFPIPKDVLPLTIMISSFLGINLIIERGKWFFRNSVLVVIIEHLKLIDPKNVFPEDYTKPDNFNKVFDTIATIFACILLATALVSLSIWCFDSNVNQMAKICNFSATVKSESAKYSVNGQIECKDGFGTFDVNVFVVCFGVALLVAGFGHYLCNSQRIKLCKWLGAITLKNEKDVKTNKKFADLLLILGGIIVLLCYIIHLLTEQLHSSIHHLCKLLLFTALALLTCYNYCKAKDHIAKCVAHAKKKIDP